MDDFLTKVKELEVSATSLTPSAEQKASVDNLISALNSFINETTDGI